MDGFSGEVGTASVFFDNFFFVFFDGKEFF